MAVQRFSKSIQPVSKLIFEYEFSEWKTDTIYPVHDTRFGFTLDWELKYLCYEGGTAIRLKSCTQKNTYGKVKSYSSKDSKKIILQKTWCENDDFPIQFEMKHDLKVTVYVTIEILYDTYSNLQKNFDALIEMNEENWSDVTFILGDQKFKAHKAILAARSPVFAKMFKTDMSEKNTNEIEIHGDDPQTFKELLGVIYTGPWQHYVADNAKNLFILADKYQIDDLKMESSKILKHSVNVDNVTNWLIFADQYNSKYLKTAACQFFIENISNILEKNSYKQIFDMKYIHLIDELFHAVKLPTDK